MGGLDLIFYPSIKSLDLLKWTKSVACKTVCIHARVQHQARYLVGCVSRRFLHRFVSTEHSCLRLVRDEPPANNVNLARPPTSCIFNTAACPAGACVNLSGWYSSQIADSHADYWTSVNLGGRLHVSSSSVLLRNYCTCSTTHSFILSCS